MEIIEIPIDVIHDPAWEMRNSLRCFSWINRKLINVNFSCERRKIIKTLMIEANNLILFNIFSIICLFTILLRVCQVVFSVEKLNEIVRARAQEIGAQQTIKTALARTTQASKKETISILFYFFSLFVCVCWRLAASLHS